jgi:hypothetical protein
VVHEYRKRLLGILWLGLKRIHSVRGGEDAAETHPDSETDVIRG